MNRVNLYTPALKRRMFLMKVGKRAIVLSILASGLLYTHSKYKDVDQIVTQQAQVRSLSTYQLPSLDGFSIKKTVRGTEVEFSVGDFFEPGRADLTLYGRKQIRKILDFLSKEGENRKIVVESHTDSSPIKKNKHLFKSNQQLSAARSVSLMSFLKESGMVSSEIVPIGRGSTDQLFPNSRIYHNRIRNRRVVISVSDVFCHSNQERIECTEEST